MGVAITSKRGVSIMSKKRQRVRLFGRKCDICQGKGYHINFNKYRKEVHTTCLVCRGTTRRSD